MWIRERTPNSEPSGQSIGAWTNIYTYSKSLSEQIIAQQDDIVKVLVRPSIVESSNQYPFSGLENEGFHHDGAAYSNRAFAATHNSGQRKADPGFIPVDMVGGAILAAAMTHWSTQSRRSFVQASSGDFQS